MTVKTLQIINGIFLIGNIVLMFINWYCASTTGDLGNIGAMIACGTVSILLLITMAWTNIKEKMNHFSYTMHVEEINR